MTLAGLMVIGGVAAALWWWIDPLDWRLAGDSEVISPEGGGGATMLTIQSLMRPKRARKEALRDRTLELNVDRAYITQLTDQFFFEQNPDRRGIQLTDQPQDAALRAEWDAIAADNLDLIEANLSPAARERLGRYNPADTDRWRRQANELNVSENALFDPGRCSFSATLSGPAPGGVCGNPGGPNLVWSGARQLDSIAIWRST